MSRPYTVLQLITNAYYISGVVSRDFQTVSGSQYQDGLQMLNEILTDKTVEDDMVPYYNRFEFPAVQAQSEYFIKNLIELDTLVFFIGSIRYEMKNLERRRFFGSARADNIQSLPFTYHVERRTGGALLFLYFVPNTAYPMEAWGQFGLTEVSLNQDLTSELTTFNLGEPLSTGTCTLGIGQLVINGIDMTGNYPAAGLLTSAQVLANAITNNVPFVSAAIDSNQFILTSNINITVTTRGNGNPANTITFGYFATILGPTSETLFPMILDQFYISYLKYSLANRICCEFDYAIPASVKLQLDKYEAMISKRSQQLDLRMEKISTLTTDRSLNYGQINLGKGWDI
jgi:hypothetical protein